MIPVRQALIASLLLAGALTAAAGCGGPGSAQPTDPAAAARQQVIDTADADCLADRGPLVVVTGAGQNMTAAIEAGSGDTGVVLLHQVDGTMCQWYPYALVLAQKGYRTLAPDITSRDAVEVAQAAIAHLRAEGAKRVFVLGASRGGTIALAAAAATTPPVDGVIALSAPTVYDANATTAVKTLAVPTIFAAGDLDGTFPDHARELYSLSVSTHKRLIIRSSADHGVSLLGGDLDDIVLAFLTDPVSATAAGQS
ncbi:hypothetical protein Cs7R123_43150 [Catellatospora sp. TT07R-123]|uniref:alpha/beta hydrolase n=1 Tax=Catellatospora sp. TT07R-123 TaxID=2733863 RepID=UPI001B05042C|nr:hypothetical protein [Catellatospora sp. TT07R-123]GHJ46973.1 hypothetical protein Cs7R123_43150 [Catellatospora sp. TT07R-123]